MASLSHPPRAFHDSGKSGAAFGTIAHRRLAGFASAMGAAEHCPVLLDVVANDTAVAVIVTGASLWIAHSKLSKVKLRPSCVI
jgi:hypothetical protein